MITGGSPKVLFLATRPPFPPDTGRKRTLYDCLRYFATEMGCSLSVAAWPDTTSQHVALASGDAVPSFIRTYHTLRPFGLVGRLPSVLKDSLLTRQCPLQVSLYQSRVNRALVDRLIENEKPDLVVADMIRTAPYLADKPLPKILDLDDLLSVRYRRQVTAGYTGSPYGKLGGLLPRRLSALARGAGINRMILHREAELLEQYEVAMAHKYDATVLVSPVEAALLRSRIGEEKVFVVPPAVPDSLFSVEWLGNHDGLVAFMGALDVAHNESAVFHLVKDIWPRVRGRIPSARLLLLGSSPSAAIRHFAKDGSITITGWVDDPLRYLRPVQVFAAPLTFGSGIKIKILEAMASGVPVVTTSIGAEGTGATPGKHLIVADDPDMFSNEVVRLLRSRSLRQRLSQASRQFVRENFNYSKSMGNWKEVVRSVLTSHC